ncbi:hypothetical protein HELRODRAFT_66682, partial [Helobdella robusta]|uniref:Eukaryotic translation initiation factor 2 subunit 2 n=1 Tax=Helobdella robusta TaxID=6412 RepID=T1FYP0_HELRO
VFDPNLSKKKKKKKKPFDIDGLESTAPPEEVPATATLPPVESPVEKTNVAEPEIDPTDELLDLTLDKKKKKKKKQIDLSELGSALPEVVGSGEAGAGDVEDEKQATLLDNDDNIDFTMKKKKKKKDKTLVETTVSEKLQILNNNIADDVDGTATSIEQSDNDYTYEELLARVFEIMREKNPDMVAGEKKKFVMKPPQVMRVGTKKTSFCNFAEICRLLHRSTKHLQAFLSAELGTSGSLDAQSQLIIKGRFQQKQIESVLRRYIKEYVTCHTCKSPETMLQKETRLFFLQCETCGSRCSVASIKSGFQAVTGKRAAIRARTT